MKTVVTHIAPDLDAITSVWLVRKYLPGWSKSKVVFVPAGSTLDAADPDTDPEVIHVDTGMGKFDHHQTDEYTTATKRMFEFLSKKEYVPKKSLVPLSRLVEFVNDMDHFGEVRFPQADDDRYDFCLHQLVFGLRAILSGDDVEVVRHASLFLDAVFYILTLKSQAEDEIKAGLTLHTRYGKTLLLETKNQETIKLALKQGFSCIVTKDPDRGNVRIKTLPDKKLDLTPVYKKILSVDKKGKWFFHVSKNMLLNASSKNPHFTPTSLTIHQLVAIMKGV